MKAAIYARYSTDLQRDESIEDQIRVCKDKLTQEGWTLTNCYTDHAETGSNLLRPGIQALLQDALAGKFDIVITEDLDRISRDQEDTAGVFKRMQFSQVEIFTLSDGYITDLHVGLKSTMNAIQLKQIGQKVRRGQRGRVAAGKIPGGNSYGYKVVHQLDAQGNLLRGDREIDADQALIVVRIFEEYAAGHSPRAICGRLNKEGVVGPSGKDWSQSAINGNRKRGNGLLNNELYIGQIVYNRQTFVKNPDTGKRIARLNPEEDWVRQAVPELRIVADDLWKAVKARQKKLDAKGPELWQAKRPPNLFSYLLKCGECGSGFGMISKTHLGCSGSRNKGNCDNRKTIKREDLEQKVLGALRTHLMSPDLCKEFCDEYTKQINLIRSKHNTSLNAMYREFDQLERDKKKLVQSILNGVPGDVLKDEGIRIQTRMEQLEAILANAQEAPPIFHPNMSLRYHEEVQRLIAALNTQDHRAEAADIIRTLIDKIVLTPTLDRQSLVIDLHGALAGILSMASGKAHEEVDAMLNATVDTDAAKPQSPKNTEDFTNSQRLLVAGECNRGNLRPCENGQQIKLGAGVGFEPTTFRL